MKQVIFDIGMHVGRDTEFYLRKGFRVISVEADPVHVAEAEKKFQAEIQSGRLTIINKAIVEDETETVDFYVNEKKDDWGTLLPDWNRSLNTDFQKISVQAVRLENLIKEHGMPHFLKIDIEGADVFCLRSLMRLGEIPEYVSLELMTPNNLPDKEVESLEILCYLRALGYQKFQISDQSKLKQVLCPLPAKEGEYVDFQFDSYSSGLFGRELQTPTYSVDQVAEMYLDFYYGRRPSLLSRLSGARPNSPFHKKGWFDIHARKS